MQNVDNEPQLGYKKLLKNSNVKTQ